MDAINMEDFRKEFADLQQKVTEIYQILIGHQHDEAMGLLYWKKESEKRILKLEKFRDKLIWIAVGMSIPTGLGIFKIVQIIVQYVK